MSAPYPYDLTPSDGPFLGLVALQSDQTIESDLRRMLPSGSELYVSRVPSAAEVTSENLAQMERHLTQAASLLPPQVMYDVVGYGCTSGTAEIGVEVVTRHVQAGTRTRAVTQPVSALLAACDTLGLRRIAILSPYVAEVSDTLRRVLAEAGVDTPVFGSFHEAEEARVVRIDRASIEAAARDLMRDAQVDGLFLSCTNLRTLDAIKPLEDALGVPVLSSNLVIGWHMAGLAGQALVTGPAEAFARGRLFEKPFSGRAI
ncbi:maleate cis-trans isomerase family protein [Aestuariivita boseongensis]|uniref:maleate cis-trans isomerase family protein n=1 Tax=Aestuariivita boseongensis TaxID=1470562 RepID=UPI00068277C9|nr:aspartate/glutamate racemase family protein [Aestuariivita boseongensis]